MHLIERKTTAIVVRACVRGAFALMDTAQWIARRATRRDPRVRDLIEEVGRDLVRGDRRNNSQGGEG